MSRLVWWLRIVGVFYLLQFVVPRTITEHTVRRGFAPPVSEGE